MITLSSIQLKNIKLPFFHPFKSAHGVVTSRELILLKLTDCLGHTVYSECSALNQPSYHPETISDAYQTLETIIPRLLNKSLQPQTISEDLLLDYPQKPFAIASIEMGLWALLAKQRSEPLSKVLGSNQNQVASGCVVGLSSEAEILNLIQLATKNACHKLKFKVTPDTIQDRLDLINRLCLHDRFSCIALDGNESFQKEHLSTLESLHNHSISYIEQPFSRHHLPLIDEYHTINKVPLLLDESLGDNPSDIIQDPRVSGIVIKPAMLGGLQPAKSLINLAKLHKKSVVIGGLFESGIGKGYALSLASLLKDSFPSDFSPSNRYFHQDVTQDWIPNKSGYFTCPNSNFFSSDLSEHSF